MKNYLLLFALFMVTSPLLAQFGISGGYALLNASEWETAVEEALPGQQDFMSEGSVWLGVDYWFRLKNKRVEFLPTLTYRSFTDELINPLSSNSNPNYAQLDIVGFHFNTNIYPFDFNSDCECPTWSKGNDAFKKGFFIQLSPGVEQFRQQYSVAEGTGEIINGVEVMNQATTEDNAFYLSLGAAVGLDIGLSDLITLSPIAGLRYSSEVAWTALAEDLATNPDDKANVLTPYAGLRVGVRLNQ